MNKVVKTVLLVTHPTRPEAISAANELTELLTDKQINVFATIKTDGANDFKATDQIDLAVVLVAMARCCEQLKYFEANRCQFLVSI